MKRTIFLLLILLLTFSLLTACGNTAPAPADTVPASTATPVPTAAPEATSVPETAAPVTTASPTPAPTATPVPVPTATPAPAGNGFTSLLREAEQNYHLGVAGSSLTAARMAGQMVDWYINNGEEAVLAGAMAFTPGDAAFRDKLNMLYAVACGFTGYYGSGLLDSAGYYPQYYPYSMSTIRAAFTPAFSGCGYTAPTMLRAYTSDANAEHFLASGSEISALDAEGFNQALKYTVLTDGAAILSLREENGMVYADMNSAFRTLVQSQGTSGERAIIGALVNTLLDNLNASSVVLTVEGGTLETGHEVYSYPLFFCTD